MLFSASASAAAGYLVLKHQISTWRKPLGQKRHVQTTNKGVLGESGRGNGLHFPAALLLRSANINNFPNILLQPELTVFILAALTTN